MARVPCLIPVSDTRRVFVTDPRRAFVPDPSSKEKGQPVLRVIISPAKKMVAGSESFAVAGVPALSSRARRLLAALSSLDERELQALWKVSDKLLPSCLGTLRELERTGLPLSDEDLADPAFSSRASPAAFAYVGIQYQSMAPGVMTEREITWLREHLRIISGFYGCLRPFDAVLPYRLEMGARLAVDGARDLYGFWGGTIAREVCRAGIDGTSEETGRGADEGEGRGDDDVAGAGNTVSEDEDDAAGETGGPERPDRHREAGPVGETVGGPVHVVTLASVEYSKAVLPHLTGLGTTCTTCIFGEELRDGRPVQRSTASKTARGSMVRWMAQNGIDDARDLASFDVGYAYAPELSKDGLLVFMRV